MTNDTFPAWPIPALKWRRALEPPIADTVRQCLARVYGDNQEELRRRTALIQKVLTRFVEHFGDAPVRIFRAPGRINLRGMHVDTHGGYLNLMTHQREVVAVMAPAESGRCVFVNTDPAFIEVSFSFEETRPPEYDTWLDFITDPQTVRQVALRKGDWSNYLRGTVIRARRELGSRPFGGIRCVIGSDVPRGAALSSSHALCLAVLLGVLHIHSADMDATRRILAVRDAEWYTGARTGVSDQAAMVLGRRGMLVNAALLADDLDLSGVQRIPFPDMLRVLVIDSHTSRNLSGAQLSAYAANRFAYSMALEILRQELLSMGIAPDCVAAMDRLSRIDADALGGPHSIVQLLRRIPVSLSPEELRDRYQIADFDEIYARYFGGVPPAHRPTCINLRGPLLFGLAESDRARRFAQALKSEDYTLAGRLMNVGHDGDRVVDAEGSPFRRDVGDKVLDAMEQGDLPLAFWPGDYGASSPVLDALVDSANAAGALGASLTGAGIAGVVLALCRAEDADHIAEAVRATMATEHYAALARRDAPLDAGELAETVVVNCAPEGAGELRINDAPGDL